MERTGRADRFTTLLLVVIAGAIVLQNFLTVRVMRQVEALSTLATGGAGRIEGESAGPAPGEIAPEFAFLDTKNRTWTREDLSGKPALLVFSSPTCKFCKQFYPELRRLSRDEASEGLQILVFQLGSTPEENLRLQEEEDFPFEVLSADQDSFGAFNVPGTPFSILLDVDGRVVRSGTVNSFERLAEFVRS